MHVELDFNDNKVLNFLDQILITNEVLLYFLT